MGNELKLALLAMLDVDGSATEMAKQFPQLHDKLKDLAIKIKIDTGSLEIFKRQLSDLQKYQQEIQGKAFTPQPVANVAGVAGKAVGPSTQNRELLELTNALEQRFSGMSASMSKFSTDVESGFSKATVSIKNTDGIVQQFNVSYSHLTKELYGAGDSEATLFVKTNQVVQQATASIAQLQTKMKGLHVEQNTYGSSTERLAEIEKTNAAAMNASANAINVLNGWRKSGLISQEMEIELLAKVTAARDKYTQQSNAMQTKGAMAMVDKEATDALIKYKEAFVGLINLKQKRDAGEITLENYKKEVVELANQKKIMNEIVQLSAKRAAEQNTWNQQQATKSKESANTLEIKSQVAEVQKLISLQKQLESVQSKIVAARRRGDTSVEEELIGKLEKIKSIMSETRVQLESRKDTWIPKVTQELSALDKQASQAATNVTKTLTAIDAKQKAAINQKYGAAVTQTPTGQNVGVLSKEVVENNQALAQYISTLQGEEAQIKKNNTIKKEYNAISRQIIVTTGQNKNMIKDTSYYYNESTQQLHKQGEAFRLNANRMLSWNDQIAVAIKRMAQWAVAGSLIYGTLRKMREGRTFVAGIDKDLTDIAIIQRMSRKDVQGLAQDYGDLAVKLNRSMKEISSVYTELVRQGLSLEETQTRMQTILKLSSAGAVTTAESLKIITASVNAMEVGHEKAADVLLKAANISASDVGQLGEAFTKVASSSYSAGVSIEQTTALIAGMIQTTQEGPSQIGTALKTIIARFNQINEETGEFNQDLNKVQTAIESVGVAFVNSNGQIRNVYSILKDLSQVWTTLDKNQQAYIATTAAGVRMQNRFFAIMNSFEQIDAIQLDLIDSAGVLNEAYEVSLTGVEASANRAQVALEQIWLKSIKPDFLIFLNNTKTAVLNLANTFGALNIILGVVTFSLITNSKVFKNWLTMTTVAPAAVTAVKSSIMGLNGQLLTSTVAANASTVATTGFTGALARLRVALLAVNGTFAKIAIVAAAAVAFTAAVALTVHLAQAHQRLAEKVKESADTYVKFNSTLQQSTTRVAAAQTELAALEQEFSSYGGMMAAPIESQERYNAILAELEPIFQGAMKEGESFADFMSRVGVSGLSDALAAETERIREMTENGLPEAIRLFNQTVQKEINNIGINAGDRFNAEENAQKISRELAVATRAMIEGQDWFKQLGAEEKKAVINIIPEMTFDQPVVDEASLIASSKKISEAVKTLNLDAKKQAAEGLLESFDDGTITKETLLRSLGNLINEMDKTWANSADKSQKAAYDYGVKTLQGYQRSISDRADALDPTMMGLETLADMGQKNQAKQKMSNDAMNEFNRLGSLSADTIKAIIAEYPQYTNLLYENGEQTKITLGLLEQKIALERASSAEQMSSGLAAVQEKIRQNAVEIGQLEESGKSKERLKELQAAQTSLIQEEVSIKQKLIVVNQSLAESDEDRLTSLADSKTVLDDYTKYMTEFGEQGAFSYETIIEIMGKYRGQLGDVASDHEALYAKIVELTSSEEQLHQEKYAIMMMGNAAYFEGIMANNKAYFEQLADWLGIDIANFTSAAETKRAIEEALINSLGSQWASYYDSSKKALTASGEALRNMYLRMGKGDSPEMLALDNLGTLSNPFEKFKGDFKVPDFASKFDKGKQSVEKTAKEVKKFTQELDLLSIKMGVVTRQTSALEAALNSAFTENRKKDLFTQLTSSYEEKAKLLKEAIDYYQKSLDTEMAKLSEPMQANLLYGGGTIEIITDESTGKQVESVQKIQNKLAELQDEVAALNQTKVDMFSQRLDNMSTSSTLALEEMEHQLGMIDDTAENFGIRNQMMASGMVVLENELVETTQALAMLGMELAKGNINYDQYAKLQDQLIQKQRDFQNRSRDLLAQRRQEAERLADQEISLVKKGYERQKEAAINAIKAKMDAEEKAHDRMMGYLDDELERYNSIIDAKLKSIDRGESQRTYDMELEALQTERDKIQEQINTLQLDDSLEGRGKVVDLNAQLSEQDKEIAELQHKRNIELRKDNLNDLKESKNDEIERNKDAEQKKFDLYKETREAELKVAEEHWTALIEDETKYDAMRKTLVQQHLGDTKKLHDEFLADWEHSQASAYTRLAQHLKMLQQEQAKLADGGSLLNHQYTTGVSVGKTPGGEDQFAVNGGVSGQIGFETAGEIIARQRIRWSGRKALNDQAGMERILAETRNAIGDQAFKFRKGGETEGTGMHWLDGTKREPERVLSAEQTASFNKLIQMLPSLLPSFQTTQNSLQTAMSGLVAKKPISENKFTVDINIDKMYGTKENGDKIAEGFAENLKRKGFVLSYDS